MAAVTQVVPNFLGGVSRQTDHKKLPGQVRECLNAYPDPTFGLMKRPGFKYIKTLKTSANANSPDYATAKWFFIKRDDERTYIGNISGASINVWDSDGTAITVNTPDGTSYLDTTRDNYDILTVQDTTIITNKTKKVLELAAPTTHIVNSSGTVRIVNVAYSCKYSVSLKVGNTTHTVNYTTLNAENLSDPTSGQPKEEKYNTAEHILKALEGGGSAPYNAGLKNLSISGHTLTVERLNSSLELSLATTGGTATAFELTVTDNQGNANISAFNEQVSNVAQLPAESLHNRKVKVINSGAVQDIYWSRFVADNTTSGKGYWEETLDPTVSLGMNDTTLPHELRWHLNNSNVAEFTFQKAPWINRTVGDAVTNANPKFVGFTIQQAFFHNNRLGFLTEDNVSMSKSDDFYNFFYTSALTQTDADPIGINCSSIRPAVLHAVLPTAQGLILFSKNQQFIMFSDAEILTPASAVIRGISNYEMDATIDPIDNGTILNFVSKTPSYTRIFGMQTRGSEESPQVIDIGKIVSEWVPDTVTSLIASPQNSLIALYGTLDSVMYIYKTYAAGEKMLMQSWFKWDLPGNIQHASIDSDTMWAVVEKSGVYHLVSTSLTQTPEDTIITTSDGQQINPHMDMYTAATNGAAGGAEKKVVYDTGGDFSKCYIPYADITTLNPVILIAGNATQDFSGVTEFGFTVNPTRASDGDGTYFKVEGKDLSSQAANVYVGYQYNYDVELPKTYFKLNPEGTQYDYTAALTVARMKFAVGLSSVVSFKVKSKGYRGELKEFTGDGSTTAFKVPFPLKTENGIVVKLDGAKQASSTYSVSTTDAQATVTFNTAPAGASTTANVTTPAKKIEITTDTWYDVQPTQDAGQYLADDVPLIEESVFTVPVHQRSDNFNLRVFSNSPFPVSLTSMMWEGQYSPRFYRRT